MRPGPGRPVSPAGFILAALLVAAAPARAEGPDYWLLAVSSDHGRFDFVDAATIAYDGPFRSAWFTRIAAGKALAKDETRRTMTFAMFDCGANRSRPLRVVTYDRRDAVQTDRAHDRDAFQAITPGSLEALEREFVCASPESWAARKPWREIDTTPDKAADADNRDFLAQRAR